MASYSENKAVKSGFFQKIRARLRESRFFSAVILLVVMTVCVVLLSYIPLKTDEPFKETDKGWEVQQNLFAGNNYDDIIDIEMTKKARVKAREDLPLYYKMDTQKRDKVISDLDTFHKEIKDRIVAEANNTAYSGVERGFIGQIVSNMPQTVMTAFRKAEASGRLSKDIEFWADIINRGILSDAEIIPMRKKVLVFAEGKENGTDKDKPVEQWIRINPEDQILQYRLEPVTRRMAEDICSELPADQDHQENTRKYIKDEVFKKLVTHNLIYNEAKTKEREDKDLKEIKIKCPIYEGQLLFSKGDMLTKEQMKIFSDKVKTNSGKNRRSLTVITQIVVVLFLLVFICIYIYHIHPEIMRNNGSIGK